MLRQAAERASEMVGDSISASTILAHAILADGIRNVVAGASAIDIKRGRDRDRRGCVARIVPASLDLKRESSGGRDFRAKRRNDRRPCGG